MAMKPNPFETSPEQKALNLDRVRAERERLDEVRGWRGSDGVVLDAFSDFGSRALRDGGALDQMAQAAFGDPDGELGGLAAGIGEKVGAIKGKLGGGQTPLQG